MTSHAPPPRARHARPDYSFGSAPDQSQHTIDFDIVSDEAISPTNPTEQARRPRAASANGSSMKLPTVMRPMALSCYVFAFLFCSCSCFCSSWDEFPSYVSPYLLRALLSVEFVIPLHSIQLRSRIAPHVGHRFRLELTCSLRSRTSSWFTRFSSFGFFRFQPIRF